MGRDFFRRPSAGRTAVSGTTISSIQLSLNAVSGANIDVDGIYGGQTANALSNYQSHLGLQATGNVSDATWSALMRTDEPAIFERCLQVVASFEGTGFTRIVGNFDGAGVTWGIIGFTLLGGELGEVLNQINAVAPDALTKAFGHDAEAILNITGPATTDAQKTEWANSVSRGTSRYDVVEPWKTYFHNLGSLREVQAIQVARAKQIYWSKAIADASLFNLTEELDYLLMYDCAVQNGGVKKSLRAQIQADLARAANATEKREVVAKAVASSAKPKYQHDVLARKMAIATGGGVVHGGKYQLDCWGLMDGFSPKTV